MEHAQLRTPEWEHAVLSANTFYERVQVVFNLWKTLQKGKRAEPLSAELVDDSGATPRLRRIDPLLKAALMRLKQLSEDLNWEEKQIYKLCFGLLSEGERTVNHSCDYLRKYLSSGDNSVEKVRGVPITVVSPRGFAGGFSFARA